MRRLRRIVVREDSRSAEGCLVAGLRWRLRLFAAVRDRTRFSACEPVGEHGGGGLHGNRGLLPFEHERQISEHPCPPRDEHDLLAIV